MGQSREHAIDRSWPEAPSGTPPSWRPLHRHRYATVGEVQERKPVERRGIPLAQVPEHRLPGAKRRRPRTTQGDGSPSHSLLPERACHRRRTRPPRRPEITGESSSIKPSDHGRGSGAPEGYVETPDLESKYDSGRR